MLSPVSPTDATAGAARQPRGSEPRLVRSLDVQIREVGRALERSKRDLAAAFTRAELQDQRVADARRKLEQLRWIKASADENPELARLAAAEIATHNAVIEAAKRAEANMSSQIARLQGRVERQTTRFFDLQSRRREGNDGDPVNAADARKPRPASVEQQTGRSSDSRTAEVEQALLDQLVQIGLRAAERGEKGSRDRAGRRRFDEIETPRAAPVFRAPEFSV